MTRSYLTLYLSIAWLSILGHALLGVVGYSLVTNPNARAVFGLFVVMFTFAILTAYAIVRVTDAVRDHKMRKVR